MLTLKWRRVENGLWCAGPYVLRYGANRGTWRIEKNERRMTEATTLKAAKRVCVENYEAEQRSAIPDPPPPVSAAPATGDSRYSRPIKIF